MSNPISALPSGRSRSRRLSDSGGWIRVGPVYRTRGGNDQLTINLDEGTYRAVVPAQRNYSESMSAVVVLKK